MYKCESSGFRFYYPFDINGDALFYSKLQKYDWYYIPWKWEHEICKGMIRKGSKILEVGCGKGSFLKKIYQEKGAEITGLELNKEAIREGEKNGVPILDETIQNHALKNNEQYDMVCSFQVLEHISDVNSFIQAKLDCLKKNGKLVIAVPNNDSFIKFDKTNLLNLPPHHMGLWNPCSVKALGKVFNIKLERIYLEPLQEVHFPWYFFTQISRIQGRNKFIGKIVEKLSLPVYKPFLQLTNRFIVGQTMLAVFEK